MFIALEVDVQNYRHVFFRIESTKYENLDQISYLMTCLYHLKVKLVERGIKEIAIRANNICFREINWETLYALLDGVFRKTNVSIYALLNYIDPNADEEDEQLYSPQC